MQTLIFYTDTAGWKRSNRPGGYEYEVWAERMSEKDWQIEIRLEDIQSLQFDEELGHFVVITK